MFPSLDSNASNFSVFDAHMECSLKDRRNQFSRSLTQLDTEQYTPLVVIDRPQIIQIFLNKFLLFCECMKYFMSLRLYQRISWVIDGKEIRIKFIFKIQMVDPQVFHHTILPYNLIYYYLIKLNNAFNIFPILPHLTLLILKLTPQLNSKSQLINLIMNNLQEKRNQEKQFHIQKFSDIILYILQNILIDSNIKQTCYFPSRHKIKRIFHMYTQVGLQKEQKVKYKGKTQNKQEKYDEEINYEYILCFIMIKQYKRHYGKEANHFSQIITKLIGEKEQILNIFVSKTHALNKIFIIHESSLINLLSKLIKIQYADKKREQKEKVQKQSKQNQEQYQKRSIYDFNEIENDSYSILFQE